MCTIKLSASITNHSSLIYNGRTYIINCHSLFNPYNVHVGLNIYLFSRTTI